jgi:NAD(P)-dependent dehydrogenase (short-subunit alcohol dehydrogenase family)
MPKSILISGASSGVGKALSLGLDRLGYRVFAGVRKGEDAEALSSQASPQLTPLILDITQPEAISAACKQVARTTGGGLFCLINNAGVSYSGAMEFMPLEDFHQQMEVNLFGQLALTQACLPLLRQERGRVLLISSVAGRLATAFNGPYSCSKAALVAMADALRLELSPWGIGIVVLILGSVQTPIWEKAAHTAGEILRRGPEEAWNMYGKYQKQAGRFYQQAGLHGMDVKKLVPVVQRVLQSRNPKPYMLVGRDALMFELMAKLLPVRWRDWLVLRQMGLLNV